MTASGESIVARFVRTAERVPGRTFLVAAPSLGRLGYGAVLARARGFADLLAGHGVKPGDRVVLNAPNSAEYVCAYFGAWLAGATIVPLDPRARPSHVAHVCRDSDATAIVVAGRRDGLPRGVSEIVLGDLDWQALSDPRDRGLPVNPLALVIYTSGTTGSPKGVCLTHRNLDHTRAAITSWAGVQEDDRELTTLSLTHLFGLGHLHVYAALGATVYIDDGLRDVPRLLDLISREGITSFPGTPAGFRVLVDRFPDLLRSHGRGLRYIVINTAPMPPELTRKLLDLLPHTRVYMYYGLTEASRSTYIAYRDHPGKLETVGRPSPGTELCIGSPARPLIEEPGEILVRGPHVTAGYWGIDSSPHFEDGWFRTGDLGTVDREGFVTWIGRVRDQINVDGLKLVPSEVEAVLRQDPRVLECAVVGAPDPLTGESVAAFVVPAGRPEDPLALELRKLCSRHLEFYKVPKRIVFVDGIPKTDSGKIQRFLLRERLSAPDA